MLAEIEFHWGTKVPYDTAKSLAELLEQKLEDIINDKQSDEGTVELISWNTYVVDIEELNSIIPNTPFTIKRLLKQKYDKVNVHVPNLGLLIINEVNCLENCSTGVLQEYLDKGWRILAVCQQPDKNRPDYILGRTKG
ncbi:MAG: hypothetical protein GX664_04030 [Bacteroidales bacterium]|nr:hypothetical protein [Bacteroidales bacterium]